MENKKKQAFVLDANDKTRLGEIRKDLDRVSIQINALEWGRDPMNYDLEGMADDLHEAWLVVSDLADRKREFTA